MRWYWAMMAASGTGLRLGVVHRCALMVEHRPHALAVLLFDLGVVLVDQDLSSSICVVMLSAVSRYTSLAFAPWQIFSAPYIWSLADPQVFNSSTYSSLSVAD
jgi:hypothetical protein